MLKGRIQKKSAPVSRSGRFADGPQTEVAKFTESISFDWRLWREDILGSITHAAMLRQAGLLSAREYRDIVEGFEAIAADIREGRFEWKTEFEDVHMNLEAELTRRVPAGAKLHAGRSRNDQIALDMRMWLRREIVALAREVLGLQRALVELGNRYPATLIPGYTHLQRAQPVYFAHHLLAYVEMLERDHERLRDTFKRTNVCPLGSGAIAGSTLPLDREYVARHLGFVDAQGRPRLSQNSMDAVSDRDFLIEFNFTAALLAVHLSRLAEDLILWNTTEFGFIRIDDAYTTGSSLMPQKKNPDLAELTRGKAARVIGNLMALLALLKGLPMTYNRDLQEDKQRLFDSADTMRATVSIMAAMLHHTRVNPTPCAAAAGDPALLATDLAEYLVRRGLPFRQAHHAVGAAVALAERLGKPLNRLTVEEFQSIEARFDRDVAAVFDLKRAMAARQLPGSPGTKQVKLQLRRWHRILARRPTNDKP
jgi:argininosuccinate lyase